MWDRNRSTSGPTPWHIYNDNEYDDDGGDRLILSGEIIAFIAGITRLWEEKNAKVLKYQTCWYVQISLGAKELK